MSSSDLREDINVTDTLNKNYWPAELIQDNVRGSSRQADTVVCQPYVTGYMYLRLCANVGAAAGLNTPGNGEENPISCQCQSIKDWQCPWWGKSSP